MHLECFPVIFHVPLSLGFIYQWFVSGAFIDMISPLYAFKNPQIKTSFIRWGASVAGHNILESLNFPVYITGVSDETVDIYSKKWRNNWWNLNGLLENRFPLTSESTQWRPSRRRWARHQFLSEKYLSHLSKLESVAFTYSAYVAVCHDNVNEKIL